MKLQRHSVNPILIPDPTSDWECYNVFNPGVLYHQGLFHMFYRAQGLDWVSRIGYANSPDGVHWNRLRQPVLTPNDGSDSRGVEDARVVEIEGRFYMTYTAYGREAYNKSEAYTFFGGGITPMIASSENLVTWKPVGAIVHGEDNKDHVLFPRKIHGRFAAFHRRRPHVWIAYSTDLETWKETDMAPIYSPREENWWDNHSVGSNGVPIETPYGWVCINHAYDQQSTYRLGVILLDLDDPTKVLHRPKEPIFWPEEIWEMRGDVPRVVFSCANPVVDGTVNVFYGGADHVIGLATCPLNELIEYARSG
jgi:beta-1,2-mannobiose phosphorylase / 1,2-beta-oligomannan phosphorylase